MRRRRCPGGEVDGDGCARLMRRVHLGAEQVELQPRMHDPDPCRVIAVTVVTDRETGDRIDRRIFQPPPEFGGIERGPHLRDLPRGVEVQMNLAIRKGRHGSFAFLLSIYFSAT